MGVCMRTRERESVSQILMPSRLICNYKFKASKSVTNYKRTSENDHAGVDPKDS